MRVRATARVLFPAGLTCSQILPILAVIVIAFVFRRAHAAAGHGAPTAPSRTSEKLAPYECGSSFEDARTEARRALTTSLRSFSSLFALETPFSFPAAVTLKEIGSFGFWS